MAKYVIAASVAFIEGKKYRRGEIVEVARPEEHGTRIELVPEAPKKEERKPKAVRKPRAKKAAE